MIDSWTPMPTTYQKTDKINLMKSVHLWRDHEQDWILGLHCLFVNPAKTPHCYSFKLLHQYNSLKSIFQWLMNFENEYFFCMNVTKSVLNTSLFVFRAYFSASNAILWFHGKRALEEQITFICDWQKTASKGIISLKEEKVIILCLNKLV